MLDAFSGDEERRLLVHGRSQDFVIDLDTICADGRRVWEWAGFTTKGNAKRLLVKEAHGWRRLQDWTQCIYHFGEMTPWIAPNASC